MKPIQIIFRKTIIAILLIVVFAPQSNAQSSKKKKKKNKSVAMWECGYVHKLSLAEKLNPMKGLQKIMGNAVTDGNNSDLGTAAISVFYQAHLHPQNIMKYPTATPGWETCGDAVFAGFTNKSGIGLSSTDGQFLVDGENVKPAGIGTFFHGFKPEKRGNKTVKITSSNGNVAEVTVKPAAPLEIISVDGKAKGEEIVIDGLKDVVIELKNGDVDLKSNLHVQLISKIMGTPIIFDLIVTKPKNTIYIPKEAFKNFEGSPSPFAKNNTLIINRVTEEIVDNTDAGAIRTISAYMDWMPIKLEGDISKGSIVTAGFDESKNTKIDIDLKTAGEYNFTVAKGQPFTSPPIKLIKNVAFASFVLRGNLIDEKTDISVQGGWKTTTIQQKWFPELTDDTWQKLVNKMYFEISEKLKNELEWNILPLNTVTTSKAYKHIKSIKGGAEKTFVEVGAGNTQRILTTSSVDLWSDLSITFGGDFISQRLVKELDVDAVLAITIDLNFNFETEGLDPKVSIVAFAPDVSYKTSAKYFSMNASTTAKSLEDSRNHKGGVENVIYQMIKADSFNNDFLNALKELSTKEDTYPVYEKLWKAKF
jgi:hypothetical protein